MAASYPAVVLFVAPSCVIKRQFIKVTLPLMKSFVTVSPLLYLISFCVPEIFDVFPDKLKVQFSKMIGFSLF